MQAESGFNPYFSGSVTGTMFSTLIHFVFQCFNPYFSGSVTGTCTITL